jgi:hypothetical protein
MDCTPVYASLPGGVCQCRHYGYVFKGAAGGRLPGTDWPEEVAEPGDVFHFPAGHVLIYDEASEVLELNPVATLQQLMDHIESQAPALMGSMPAGD